MWQSLGHSKDTILPFPFLYSEICAVKNLGALPDIDIRQYAAGILADEKSIPQILILSDVHDYESDKIGQGLLRKGIDYARINSRYVPWNLDLTTRLDNESSSVEIHSGNQWVDCSRVKLILRRNFNLLEYDHFQESVVAKLFWQEWNGAIDCLLDVIHPIVITPWSLEARWSTPIYQLLKAREYGFSIPQTTITSNLSDIQRIASDHAERFLIKAIGLHHVVHNGHRFSYFARRLDKVWDDLIKSDLTAPVLVQEVIPKKADLRITFVNGVLFQTQITSKTQDSNIIDYHYLPLDKLDYEETQISSGFAERLQTFIKNTGLFYGSIDFVVSVDERFFFLELNTTPDWHWLESAHFGGITETFVNGLEKLIS